MYPRSVLWTVCLFALPSTSSSSVRWEGATPSAPTGAGAIPLVVANGCFWGRQHIYANDLELTVFNRTARQVTAVAGYFGGKQTDRVCYDNPRNQSVYARLNHSEAVRIELLSNIELHLALEAYFNSFVELLPGIYGREDYFDRGKQYRAIIGVPGGARGKYMAVVKDANVHNMTLKDGDNIVQMDTLGKNLVYVVDAEINRFYQAELCLQFHDNQTSTYPKEYHNLKQTLLETGRLRATGCPEPYPCIDSVTDRI